VAISELKREEDLFANLYRRIFQCSLGKREHARNVRFWENWFL